MLEDILKIIDRDGYISRTAIGGELGLSKDIIDDGFNQLVRLGYLIEEETSQGCNVSCGNCPFAKTCSKDIITTYKVTAKGDRYIKSK